MTTTTDFKKMDSERPSTPMPRINISLPDEWKEAFEKEAMARGLNLSDWIRQCCIVNVRRRYKKKLTEAPSRQRYRNQ